MIKRKPLGDDLSLKERKFVNQAKPATEAKSSHQPPAKEPREHEGFMMLTELRRRMTQFSVSRKLAAKAPWTKQDLYNQAIKEFLDRNDRKSSQS